MTTPKLTSSPTPSEAEDGHQTGFSDIVENPTAFAAIVTYGDLPLKDVLELAYTSKDSYEAIGKNASVWKPFFEHYNLDTSAIPSLTRVTFFSAYNSQV